MATQCVLTIALGMGACAAVLSLMLAMGYQPLPFRAPGALVVVWERAEVGPAASAISPPDLAELSRSTRGVFQGLGGFMAMPLWLEGRPGPLRVRTLAVQSSAFRELGVRPALGRGPLPGDAGVGAAVAPAWISYRLWHQRFGGSRAVLGTPFALADSAEGAPIAQLRVVGVMPAGASLELPFLPFHADLWVLPARNIANLSRQSRVLFGLGRLRRGVSVPQAEAALTVAAARLGGRYDIDRGYRPVVEGLDAVAQGPARRTMGLLSLGVGLVFVLGCVNLAILMIAEGGRRGCEMAVRTVLGASRRRLWSIAAAEMCALVAISLVFGVELAHALLQYLARLVPAAGIGPPLLAPPPLNLAVLFSFAAIVFLEAVVWSALLVATAGARGGVSGALNAGAGQGYSGLGASARGAARWRLALLAAQAGVGLCLIAAVLIATRAYAALSTANLGPAPRRTVILSVSQRHWAALADPQAAALDARILSTLRRLPGVHAITMAGEFPPFDTPMPYLKSRDSAQAARTTTVPTAITLSYFRTLAIPILYGRNFNANDTRDSAPVAVVNLKMAEDGWPAPQDAVGAMIAYGPRFTKARMIVGVAANFGGYWARKPIPEIFRPEAQSPTGGGDVIIRAAGAPGTVAALARQALAGMPEAVTVGGNRTMEASWQAKLTRPLARMAGMLLLALLGLALSVQGIYAVTAATVAARGHELAVRAALGASRPQLVWKVTRGPLAAVAAGAVLGALATAMLRPLLTHWLGPVGGGDAAPTLAALVLIALAAAAGGYFPARAATRIAPAAALRQG